VTDEEINNFLNRYMELMQEYDQLSYALEEINKRFESILKEISFIDEKLDGENIELKKIQEELENASNKHISET